METTERNGLDDYERHPLSEMWGDIPPEDWPAFVADVARYGVQSPITLAADGRVLDGWNRLKAAAETGRLAGMPDPVRLDSEEDAAAHVIRANGLRRQLPTERRAAIVLLVREWAAPGSNQYGRKPGDRGRHGPSEPGPGPSERGPATNAELAKLAGASVTTVEKLRTQFKRGHGEALAAGRETLRSLERKARKRKRERDRKDHPEPLTRMEKLEAANAHLRAEADALRAVLAQAGVERDALRERLAAPCPGCGLPGEGAAHG